MGGANGVEVCNAAKCMEARGNVADDCPAMDNHRLLKAARSGNIDGVRSALEKGASLETRRPFVTSPKASAPKGGPAEIIGFRGTGLTPLMCSAVGGFVACVEALIKARAQVNAQDEDGMTPLHFGAISGCPDICLVLIAAGALPHTLDDNDRCPLNMVPPEIEDFKKRAFKLMLAWHPCDHAGGVVI